MKSINETFTEEEWKQLEQAKGSETWHRFIMSLAESFTVEDRTIITGELVITGGKTDE